MAGLDVLMLGQVFTPGVIVDQMLSLRRNFGRTLEPSAGAGAFSSRVPGCVAVEIDPGVAQPDALLMDFFDYPESERFDTIIGNPPYVAARGIRAETRERLQCDLFDGRSNLYLYFVEKCVRHLNPGGELIFITPRDWPKLTAARKMNVWLAEQGSITHFIETGDSRVFQGATPNCAIWRFEKGRTARILEDGRVMVERDGQLLFLKGRYSQPLGDLFEVKVGAVSGANEVFVHPHGNVEFVCSSTLATSSGCLVAEYAPSTNRTGGSGAGATTSPTVRVSTLTPRRGVTARSFITPVRITTVRCWRSFRKTLAWTSAKLSSC